MNDPTLPLLMIGAGYEDGNDASALRSEPIFMMAQGFTPLERELASQSTISRFENLPDARALLRMGRALVELYCESFQRVPERITLDIDDTFDPVHGGQQQRLFNSRRDEYGFQSIVVFDADSRFVSAMLRPAKRPRARPRDAIDMAYYRSTISIIDIGFRLRLRRMDDKYLYAGLIRLHVLHHAVREPIYGLAMIEELERHGYKISAGTLYPILHGLEGKGYLTSTEKRSGSTARRVYRATPAGAAALAVAKLKVRELFGELLKDDEPPSIKGNAHD